MTWPFAGRAGFTAVTTQGHHAMTVRREFYLSAPPADVLRRLSAAVEPDAPARDRFRRPEEFRPLRGEIRGRTFTLRRAASAPSTGVQAELHGSVELFGGGSHLVFTAGPPALLGLGNVTAMLVVLISLGGAAAGLALGASPAETAFFLLIFLGIGVAVSGFSRRENPSDEAELAAIVEALIADLSKKRS